MKLISGFFLTCLFAFSVFGCTGGEEASQVGDDPNAAAVANTSYQDSEVAKAKQNAGGNRSTREMPEGAGRAPMEEGQDMVPSGGN
jgi:hypothetical protein